jgi:Tfp pilus assembly protein PilZ
MANINRRHFSRQNEESTIQVLMAPDYFAGPKDRYDFVPVKMYNQSDDGLYIEVDRVLQPGSNVTIKMVAPERDHPEAAYFMHDGRVIWCKKVDDKTSRFGVGVKILTKVVRAEVLTSYLDRPV